MLNNGHTAKAIGFFNDLLILMSCAETCIIGNIKYVNSLQTNIVYSQVIVSTMEKNASV